MDCASQPIRACPFCRAASWKWVPAVVEDAQTFTWPLRNQPAGWSRGWVLGVSGAVDSEGCQKSILSGGRLAG